MVYVAGDPARFGRRLAAALEAEAARIPRPPPTAEEAVAIRSARAEAEFAGYGAGEEATVFGAPDLAWTVLVTEDPAPLAAPLRRLVRVCPMTDAEALETVLRPLEGRIQSIGYAGERGLAGLAEVAVRLGVARLAPLGTAAWPPSDWRHDGRFQLLPLLDWTEWEAEEQVAKGASEPDVWARYTAFLRAPPRLALEWHDPESPARAWLVLNTLRGGAAGGGTRMRAGLTREEVTFLAKVMELKFSIAGPPIGGAKSGLDFDPADPRKPEVLARWFRAIRPYLEACYATAGDLNVDELREVLPATVEIGLLHPQQGVARGHFGLAGEALADRLAAMRRGLEATVEGSLGVPGLTLRTSDLVTGFGVATAALRLYERRGRSLQDVRVLIEGFGNVGGAAALYLSRWGARVVGVVDAVSALVAPEGLGAERVEELLRAREGNTLPLSMPAKEAATARAAFREAEAEIYVCAAASGTLGRAALERLDGRGVEAIVCGANRPFASAFPGDTELERDADARFAVVPDFIANCGAARAFSHHIARDEPSEPREVFDAVETTVCEALDEAVARAGGAERGLHAAALGAALDRIGAA